eukprot:3506148-Lingulodinium_polyedra.AAC.1
MLNLLWWPLSRDRRPFVVILGHVRVMLGDLGCQDLGAVKTWPSCPRKRARQRMVSVRPTVWLK